MVVSVNASMTFVSMIVQGLVDAAAELGVHVEKVPPLEYEDGEFAYVGGQEERQVSILRDAGLRVELEDGWGVEWYEVSQ